MDFGGFLKIDQNVAIFFENAGNSEKLFGAFSGYEDEFGFLRLGGFANAIEEAMPNCGLMALEQRA